MRLPGSGGGRRGRRRLLGAAAVALALIVLGGIAVVATGDDQPGINFDVPEGVRPLGQVRAGSVAQFAECADWRKGSVERRKATVVDIRQQLSGATAQSRASISDQDAYDVFERACSNDFAEHFLLYKLYYQANAFNNLDPSQYQQP